MDEGTEGGLLHGGGYERQVFRGGGLPYMFQAGRIFTGLTVVEFLLADEGALSAPCSLTPRMTVVTGRCALQARATAASAW